MNVPSLLSPRSLFRRQHDASSSGPAEVTGISEFLSFLMGTAATFIGLRSQTQLSPPRRAGFDDEPEALRRRPLRQGQRLGPFHLLRRLGQGAQGDVWKALQLEPTVRMVALKVMNPNLRDNPTRLAQFRREAERGAKLSGPSLLPVHEHGEIDGYVFMAMPYIEGTSLKGIINARRLYEAGDEPDLSHPVVWANDETYIRFMVHALTKATRALAQVHADRVVHRDIKPANILLNFSRTDGVFLCDFGLGRDLDFATSEQLRDGSGTPMFMAPERLLREPADEMKSDIYSMGVTLFEALTLRRPFEVPENASWPALAGFLAASRPAKPTEVRPGFPLEIEAIILKAMARDPERRHATAQELAEELTEFQARWTSSDRDRQSCSRPHAPHRIYRPHFARLQDAG